MLANTLASLAVVVGAVDASARLVCWVHELDGVADRVLPPGPVRDAAVGRVDAFLAAGPAVADLLVDRWGVRSERVVVAPPFVDDLPGATADAASTVFDRGEGVPLITAVGALGDRKGTDRFVDLLAAWPDGPGAPRGRWLGGDPASVAWGEARTAVADAGLTGRVELVPTVADADRSLRMSDVVVSTAREDPFPLTVLEAGLRGRAVAATDSGGTADLLGEAGLEDLVVAPGDVLALHRVVADLLADPARRAAAGVRLQAHVRAGYLTERLAPVVWDVLEVDR